MATLLYYPPLQDGLQKTLDAELLTGVTASATLNNVTGLQNKKGVMVIDRVDGNNNLTPNKREYISFDGTSGSTVVTLARGLAGSTDQDHAVGAVVEFVNDIVQQQAIMNVLDGTTQMDSIKINEDVTITATSTEINLLSGVTALPSKATATENVTGTDDAKFLTALSNVPAFNNSLYRQAIINGNFDVWQRGTSIAMTTANAYTADRWYCETATAGTDKTVSQQDGMGVNGSYYCARVAMVQDVDELLTFSQALESQDSIKFRGKKVTLSFYARGGVEFVANNPTLVSKIVTGKGTDQKLLAFTTSADGVSQNNTLTTSWQKFTCTTTAAIASDITQIGISFAFTHAGSGVTTNYFEVTQVQLCAGDVALPFMPKSFEEEDNAAKRYANKIMTTQPYAAFGVGWAESTTLCQFVIPIGKALRNAGSVPTFTYAGNFRLVGTGAITVTELSCIDFANGYVQIRATVASGLTAGNTYILQNNNDATAYMLLSQEL